MAADDTIGEKIARRRQELGMTQDDLAAAVGVSRATVANWERGKHFPLRYRYKIEKVLGISLADEPALPPEVAANRDDDFVMRVWTEYDKLAAEERLTIIRLYLRQIRRAGSALVPAAI